MSLQAGASKIAGSSKRLVEDTAKGIGTATKSATSSAVRGIGSATSYIGNSVASGIRKSPYPFRKSSAPARASGGEETR